MKRTWVKPELLHRGWDVFRRSLSVLPAPWHPLERTEGYAPFFIVGSGRSGTTLLRRMLQAHPALHVPPETQELGRAIKVYRQSRGRPWRDVVYLVLAQFEYNENFDAFEISLGPLARRLEDTPRSQRSLAFILDSLYRYHAEQHGVHPLRWGDKSPINTLFLDRIRLVFPDMAVIHVLRDGCDVVSSFVRSGVIADLEAAADRWITSVDCAQRYGRAHPERFLELRYEALVTDPEATIRQVCALLELPFREEMLSSEDLAHRLGDVPRHAHHAMVAEPVSTKRIGKGRRSLSDEQRRRLAPLLDPALHRLGYGPVPKSPR